MEIDASELDQRIMIESRTVARDAVFGSEVVTWAELGGVGNGGAWAKADDQVEPKKGGVEVVDEHMRLVDKRTQFKIRHRADITQDMRIQWPARSRTLQITGITEIGRREGLLITCEEFSV